MCHPDAFLPASGPSAHRFPDCHLLQKNTYSGDHKRLFQDTEACVIILLILKIDSSCASFRILEDPLMVVGIGVAFAKEDDRGICEQMDQTLEEMRQDGTSLKIIKKYLDDPQKYLEVDDLGY